MATFRVEKNKNYTTMSNYHLRDKHLSNKACGLLSKMLSLPEEWDYSTRGLAAICKDGVDSIGSALKELEKCGYLVRHRIRDAKGRIADIEYVIYETPHLPVPDTDRPDAECPDTECPDTERPDTERPDTGNPDMDNPCLDNPAQLNKDITSKDRKKKDLSITEDLSLPPTPFPPEHPQTGRGKRREAITAQDIAACQEQICKSINYDALAAENQTDIEQLDEMVAIMAETLCTKRKTLRVGGVPYATGVVCGRLQDLRRDHVQFVLDCMRENTTQIRNIRQYLLTALFNAPTTIGSYYAARVNADLARVT